MYKRFVRKPGEDMNKPYIWMDDLDTWFTDEDYQNLDDLLKEGMFPLYTHPAKQLTDEEIIEIGLLTTDPRFSHIESPLLLEFARAILLKAQEK